MRGALPGCRRRAFADRRRRHGRQPTAVRSVRFRGAVGPRPRAVTCRRHTDDVSKRVRRVWRVRSFSIHQPVRHFDGFVSEPETVPPSSSSPASPSTRLICPSGPIRLDEFRCQHTVIFSFSYCPTEFPVKSSSFVQRFWTCREIVCFRSTESFGAQGARRKT